MITIKKISIVTVISLAFVLQGCATYNSVVPPANGASEILPNRVIDGTAAVHISDELSTLTRQVKLSYICSANTFNVNLGQAMTESIMRTMEGGFRQVVKVDSQAQAPAGSYYLDFSLSDFYPRLNFVPGFWVATADASTEIGIRVRAINPQGVAVTQITASGSGRSDASAGGCAHGEQTITDASHTAVRKAMEDATQKLFNTGILTEAPRK